MKQLKGQVKEKISVLREKIISKTAYIEAALDDINVSRFAEYVKRFDNNTQFILTDNRVEYSYTAYDAETSDGEWYVEFTFDGATEQTVITKPTLKQTIYPYTGNTVHPEFNNYDNPYMLIYQ